MKVAQELLGCRAPREQARPRDRIGTIELECPETRGPKIVVQYAGLRIGDDVARPVLLHQESRAGHGVGKPVGKLADAQADMLAFFSWQLGLSAGS